MDFGKRQEAYHTLNDEDELQYSNNTTNNVPSTTDSYQQNENNFDQQQQNLTNLQQQPQQTTPIVYPTMMGMMNNNVPMFVLSPPPQQQPYLPPQQPYISTVPTTTNNINSYPTIADHQYMNNNSQPSSPMMMSQVPVIILPNTNNIQTQQQLQQQHYNYNANYEPPIPDQAWVKVKGVDPIVVALANIICPGLGHAMIGQYSKAITYFVINFLLSLIIGLLAVIVIGFFLIPIQLIYYVYIIIDGYKVSERLRKGYPVLKGECYSKVTTLFVPLVEKLSPVFVYGESGEPMEWKQRCDAIDNQQINTSV
ncbi:hypothetical protein ABK040_004458 [Willaertia magna]